MPNTQEETTLILLKPDCVRKNLSGTILKRFLSEGFRLRGIKMIQLDEPVLREHTPIFWIWSSMGNRFSRSCLIS